MALARRILARKAQLPALFILLTCSAVAAGQQPLVEDSGGFGRHQQPEPMSLVFTTDVDDEFDEQPATAPAVPPPPTASAPSESKPAKKTPTLPFDLNSKRMTGDWFGVRNWMDDHFIDLEIVYTSVYQRNFKGGLNTHNADDWDGDLRENLYVDLDKMKLIPGGFFFIRGKSSYNDSVQADVGSLESTSWTIAAGDHEIYVDKWWYGQRFLKDMIEFRVGKLLTPIDLFDMNTYAMNPWNQFLNQSMDMNPTVPHRKAPGLYMKFKPVDWLSFSSGMLNANQTDSTKTFHCKTTFHNDPKWVGFYELILSPTLQGPNGSLPGNYRFGLDQDGRVSPIFRNRIATTDGIPIYAQRQRSNNIGFYTSMDQFLWKENSDPKDKQGLGAFFRYGWKKRDINKISDFWSIGAQYQGLIPKRDNDVVAFGMNQSILSSQYRHEVNVDADRETVYEWYYSIQITPWIFVTPDIQYITEPGGLKHARDSLVGSIRVKINL
ncbi:MAG TPA: carbohydrate porin [Phycisphaerae bacterium]|nr:carbohydrate porin [Phycisphaerae bacterium]